jgi:Ca2+/Na+ antiporter
VDPVLLSVLLSVANVAAAALFGGMLFFTAFFAPQAFKLLPDGVSDKFVRDLFPTFYMIAQALALIAALACAPVRTAEAIIMALVAAGFLFARYYLMPRTIRAHDEREKGTPGAAEAFADLHKRSAFLNMVQFICTLVVLVRLVG